MRVLVWKGCTVVNWGSVPGPDITIGVDPWNGCMSVDNTSYPLAEVNPENFLHLLDEPQYVRVERDDKPKRWWRR